MNTCIESLQKKNNEPNFQYTKLSVIELVLTHKKNLSGARPKSACGKYFSCRFSLSAAGNAITKATEYIISGFSFSSPSRKVWMSLSISDTDFQCFILLNPKKFWQKTFIFINLKAADWRYQTQEKKPYYFYMCCYGFLRAGCPCVTPHYRG